MNNKDSKITIEKFLKTDKTTSKKRFNPGPKKFDPDSEAAKYLQHTLATKRKTD